MSPDTITHLILQYRYWILIPLSLLEGPVVAFVAGSLSAAGYFNPYFLEVFFIIRDLVTDVAYYALGVFAGQSRFVKRLLHKIGVTAENLKKANTLWETHPLRTMFLGKLAYGIAPSFFIVAGMVRMSLPRFIGYNALVAAFQYGACLLLGYYFGNTIGRNIFSAIDKIQYLIGAVVVIYIIFHLIRSSFRKRLLKEERRALDQ